MDDRNLGPAIQIGDLAIALSLLSRLPVLVNHETAARRASVAAWAYPLAGAVIGLIAGLTAEALLFLGVPAAMTAALTLALLCGLTGALHEDGLADCADGFFGGNTPSRRLEIMSDSRIGAFGAVAIGLALLLRWTGLDALTEISLILPLMAVGAVSRLPMVLIMSVIEPARPSGLSAQVGRPSGLACAIATLIAVVLCLFAFGFGGLIIVLMALACATIVTLRAIRLIGGQTGDVLGASQQFAEIGALLAAGTIAL